MKVPAVVAFLLAVAVMASERVERCPLFSPSSVC